MPKKDTAAEEKPKAGGVPALLLEVRTPDGEVWGQIMAPAKEFKTGSQGFYANGKVTDPDSGARYQVGCNIILIGSKK